MSERNPLTLEELRKMDGKPVWVQNLEHPDRSQWRLCHWDRGKYLVLQGISIQGYLLEDYGETWLAYACEPPRLDRSAWKPCAKCRSCRSCIHVVESMNDSTGACFWCDHMNQFKPMNFCSNCGRPLTDAAWEMLEKRLRGGNDD